MRQPEKKTAVPGASPRMAVTQKVDDSNGMGEIQIHENVIASLALRAVREIEGVSRLAAGSIVDSIADFVGGRRQQGRSVAIEMLPEGRVSIQLKVILTFGARIPEIAPAIQRKVIETVESATGMTVVKVNILVQEYEADRTEEDMPEDDMIDIPNTLG